MINVFERPLLPGWVYPCTVEDIQERLAQVPTDDLEGLWAVGLVPATRKDCSANARYLSGKKPVIHIYSHRASLTYKLPAHTKPGEFVRGFDLEREWGMRVEQVGSRWVCRWEPESLRRFILDFVLLHEVGHHVHYQQRARQNLGPPPSRQVSEQFADSYACQLIRSERACRAATGVSPRTGGQDDQGSEGRLPVADRTLGFDQPVDESLRAGPPSD